MSRLDGDQRVPRAVWESLVINEEIEIPGPWVVIDEYIDIPRPLDNDRINEEIETRRAVWMAIDDEIENPELFGWEINEEIEIPEQVGC